MNEIHRVTARHLDIEGLTVLRRIKRRRRQRLILATSGVVALLLATALVIALSWRGTLDLDWRSWFAGSGSVNRAVPLTPLPKLPAPDLYRPLTAEEAQEKNAERPIEAGPGEPAAAFKLRGNDPSRLRALDCLTQAVYYEAASEGVDGGRAVAQVVLNRVRHPGYPATVCGTVYQGSERTTGCQFTFTCDGSLARTPIAYLWARSRRIAQEALAGRVFAPVGLATHYHADYVLPYWADSLSKAAVVGRHIFYRLKGANGTTLGFAQKYAASEPVPPPPPSAEAFVDAGMNAVEAATADVAAVDLPVLPRVQEDRVAPLGEAAKLILPSKPPIEADLQRGQLLLGEPGAPMKPKGRDTAEGCTEGRGNKVEAMQADDLKGLAKSVC